MAHKIAAYKQAGVEGIYLIESSLSGNWQGHILDRIEQNLEGKLRKITSCKTRACPAKARV
jgi:hypothetical protein